MADGPKQESAADQTGFPGEKEPQTQLEHCVTFTQASMGGLPALSVMEGKQAAARHEADTCWTTSSHNAKSPLFQCSLDFFFPPKMLDLETVLSL